MKKIILLILISSIAWGLSAQEPTLKTRKNRISFEPFRLPSESLGINYERELSSTISLKFLSQIVYGIDGRSYTKGFVEDMGVKFFGLKDKNVSGIGVSAYFMPYLHFSTFDILSYRRFYRPYDNDYNDREFQRDFIGYGGGFLIGFGSTFFDKIGFDIYIGGGVQSNNAPYNPYFDYNGDSDYDIYGNSSSSWEKKGIIPRGGFEVSFLF